ncbi:YjbH domain-containing protein [Albirhodobacter sp. R86504]|uniref:YjbH domain-containing protein n=1 Tax=Albirhodobacter sp. R86504 TaxID=3093848 RepID=UPI00366B226D
MQSKLVFGAASISVLLMAPAALGDPMIGKTRGTYGTPGLIDMPTAESRPDGEIGATIYRMNGTLRTTFTFQIVPRLSAAFRYSRVPGLMPIEDSPGDYEALYDRSFDIHYQFLDEAGWRPSVAVGMRDFIGTGVYSSEYLVASKSLSPDLRVTAGLGWGRLASEGGFSGYGDRPSYDYSSTGGEFNASQWFKGDIAPFAGVSYDYNERLTLKAEYSSDAYTKEVEAGEFDNKIPFNFGVDYRLGSNTHLAGYIVHGSQVGLQFTFNVDPRKPPFPSGIETAPLPVRPRPSPSADPDGWSGAWTADPTARPVIQDVVAQSMAKDGQILELMALTKDRVEVRVRNETYGAQPQAIGHIARILTRAMPSSVETFVITMTPRGVPASSVTIQRSDIEELENRNSVEILNRVQIAGTPQEPQEPLTPTQGIFPRFKWAATPYAEASLFDPDDPFRIDTGIALHGSYEIAPGWSLSGTIRQKIAGNLDESERVSDSEIYHVRSDLVEYQKHGDLAIQRLTGDWYAHPSENIYTHVQAGLLERMYGGIAGEVLWKPVDSRLALGFELAAVQQRDFDQHFSFRDYETVTGHASAYYDVGLGFTGQVDVGRYLAEDIGATIAVDREFQNGWKVGAFVTKTDLSAEEFGEGAFDKGIRVTIPVAWTTGKPSVNTVKTVIRPLTRDGGARLELDGRLYETVRGAQVGDLYDRWGRFWR